MNLYIWIYICLENNTYWIYLYVYVHCIGFVVPKDNTDWPEETWGMNLGFVCSRIRYNTSYKEKQESLISLGLMVVPSGIYMHIYIDVYIRISLGTCMHVDMHVNIGILICMYMHALIYIRMYKCIHTYSQIYRTAKPIRPMDSIYIYICIYIYIHINICRHMYMHEDIYIYICIYIYIYSRIYRTAKPIRHMDSICIYIYI
jgi:hypothetical protein